MKEINLEFLECFLNTPSPSGFELPAQKLFAEYVRPYTDTIEVDVHGNLIAGRNISGKPRLMLAAHGDEIGLIINYINDDGFLYFSPIGGVSPTRLEGMRVMVHGQEGAVPGVIARKLLAQRMENSQDKPARFQDLWIDIGARSRQEAEKVVNIGDPVTLAVNFQKLRNNLAVARGFDDRLGVFVLAESLRFLQGNEIKTALFAVSTVQEEVGSRGVWSVAYRLQPELALVVEVETATDFPEADKRMAGDIRLGKGVGFNRGSNINMRLNEFLMKVADEEGIPWHLTAVAGPTPTDASVIQTIREGVPCCLVRIPLRYMHTPSEIVSLDDVTSAVRLLVAFISRLDGSLKFSPEI
ncbi:MAG: M20/M25/M40 family metallo-hydrolase [Candidatus Omnitrophica bacterium]|nr:M20/M25/M40 family metallo-hydrolase [Candidatus Omnitrophota bacterium]